MKNNVKKIAGSMSLLLFSLIALQLNGQLIVDASVTAEEMVANILGPGVVVSNVELNCDSVGSGTFSNGGSTNIGISDGVILTSGSINNAPGPNISTNTSFQSGEPGDADLDSLIAPFATNDACVLEFDFVATADQITVQYVFASEEYNEYVCSMFNDVFAFFVSGMSPSGEEYVNQNVALVPGIDLPVAINNVNNGESGANGSPENCGSLENTAFFIDNSTIDSTSTIEYDGFTVSLYATVNIIPGETYHFKFAIADASDNILDSGVFLKAESFSIFTCDAGSLSIDSDTEICTNDDVEDVIEVSTTSILPDDTYVYLLTNDAGEILVIQESGVINMEGYANGTYSIYGVSYDQGDPSGLIVGGYVGDILNPNGCVETTEPLIIVLTDCDPEYDCPELMANIGDDCDDGNPATFGDVITPNCTCDGESLCPAPVNDMVDGALPNTPDRIWGVPGWDTFEIGGATLSMPPCDGGAPLADSWYVFEAQSENQGILARANPADPNAENVDLVIEVFDAEMVPLIDVTGGNCAESRTCFNNAPAGMIERAVPTMLKIGETYFYRVYDANGGGAEDCDLLLDTKVKTYAPHHIVSGCENTIAGPLSQWLIEDPDDLYNIPPVPVFNVRMVVLDEDENVVSMAPPKNPALPGGLHFELSEFAPDLAAGEYTIHAQNEVKMVANGCVSAFWSQLGPGCFLEVDPTENSQNLIDLGGSDIMVNLNVYPNPNNGDQVYIHLDNLMGESQKINIELLDMFGKKVISEQVASSGSVLNHILTFESKPSSGLYFVQIVVEGQMVTQKLMIE